MPATASAEPTAAPAASDAPPKDKPEAERVQDATRKLVKMVMDTMNQTQTGPQAPQPQAPAPPQPTANHEVAQLVIECPNGKTVRAEVLDPILGYAARPLPCCAVRSC